MNYAEFEAQAARLCILKALRDQPDGRMNEVMLMRILDTYAYHRSREWVRTQLMKMAELGAVTLVEAGSVMVASITRAGLDHAERRSFIAGIDRPSPEA